MIHTRRRTTAWLMAFGIPFLLGTSTTAQSGDDEQLQLRQVDATMSADEYRQAYRTNERRIRRFVKTYSENALMSLGIPKQGVRVLGAVAGAAVTQDATFYLNSGKSMAIDVKDAVQDDRAIFFAIKHKW